MNPILVKMALEKVPNANVLVNLVSRRVRQLRFGEGTESQPLVADSGNLGAADIALREIIEDQMDFDMPELVPLARPTQNGNRPKHWARM